jgi:hypothetical protein
MEYQIDKEKLYKRNPVEDSSTLIDICKHINGFGEHDYKHISDGIIEILKKEGLVKQHET